MDFFTIAIEFTVIGFGILSAVDLGSRLGAAAAGKAIATTPAHAPVDVITTGYIGDMQEFDPTEAPDVEPTYMDYIGSEAEQDGFDVPSIEDTDGWYSPPIYDNPADGWLEVRSTRSSSLSDLIRTEVSRPKSSNVAKVDHTFNLPDSIRGLRQYIRDNGLQKAVKAQVGKSVSKATKDELIAALGAI